MGMILVLAALARAADTCHAWGEAGPLTDADVDAPESSGVVAATDGADVYYTMNDAGGDAALYLFDSAGTFLAEQLIEGATNTDWEDLAPGPCPDALGGSAGERCIYIADIGDNAETRATITLWVVPESESTASIVDAVACPLVYEDGPRDAETLLVAPADAAEPGVVRIVSKEGDGEAKVYRVDALRCADTPDMLTRETELQLDGAATGGAMSATAAVIRTLESAWVWQDCSFTAATWDTAPTELALGADPQGEAIGFTADGGFITTSESAPFRFRTIPCEAPGPPPCSGCGCSTAGGSGAGWALTAGLMLALRRRRR